MKSRSIVIELIFMIISLSETVGCDLVGMRLLLTLPSSMLAALRVLNSRIKSAMAYVSDTWDWFQVSKRLCLLKNFTLLCPTPAQGTYLKILRYNYLSDSLEIAILLNEASEAGFLPHPVLPFSTFHLKAFFFALLMFFFYFPYVFLFSFCFSAKSHCCLSRSYLL